MEEYAALEHQWISLSAAQHPISHAERVPEILYFVSNLRDYIGRNGKVRAIRGVWMLSEGPSISLIYLRKVMEYSSSNGCLSM